MEQSKELQLKDQSTNDIIKKLDQQIKNLKKISDTPYFPEALTVEGFSSIDKETLIQNLIRMGSVVVAREKAYNDYAANILKLSSFPVFTATVSGGTVESVTSNIKLRIAIIQQKDKEEKLNSFKKTMTKFLTEAEQKEVALKEMEEYLSENA